MECRANGTETMVKSGSRAHTDDQTEQAKKPGGLVYSNGLRVAAKKRGLLLETGRS